MKKKNFSNIVTVAIIADPFTYNSFKYEVDLFYIEPDNWKELFKKNKPDFFFCESAWEGIDPNKRSWHHKIGWFKEEKNRTLKKIVRYCKRKHIPTIFYNKEDPVHFDKYIRAAKLFDYVFTTAVELLNKYRENGVMNIYPTLFAVQPALINPINTYERSDDIVFAGSFFNDKPERIKDQKYIFDKVIESQYNLIFYNRQSDSIHSVYDVPMEYQKYTKPSLDYTNIDIAYKQSKYAININTVKESETMFSRRVFELLASGTYIITNDSRAMNRLFSDNVYIVDDRPLVLPDGLELKHAIRKGARTVLSQHTYTDRWCEMLKNMGYVFERNDVKTITMIFDNCGNIETEKIDKIYCSQGYEHKERLVVSDHDRNFKIDTDFFIICSVGHQYNENYLTDLVLCYKYIENSVPVRDNIEKQYTFEDDLYVDYHDILFNKTDWDMIVEAFTESKKVKIKKVFNI